MEGKANAATESRRGGKKSCSEWLGGQVALGLNAVAWEESIFYGGCAGLWVAPWVGWLLGFGVGWALWMAAVMVGLL